MAWWTSELQSYKATVRFPIPGTRSARYNGRMKVTCYFRLASKRPDRVVIKDEWIERAVEFPELEVIQEDGRIRRWVRVEEMQNRYLRVVLLADGETVHNAFFDRRFEP